MSSRRSTQRDGQFPLSTSAPSVVKLTRAITGDGGCRGSARATTDSQVAFQRPLTRSRSPEPLNMNLFRLDVGAIGGGRRRGRPVKLRRDSVRQAATTSSEAGADNRKPRSEPNADSLGEASQESTYDDEGMVESDVAFDENGIVDVNEQPIGHGRDHVEVSGELVHRDEVDAYSPPNDVANQEDLLDIPSGDSDFDRDDSRIRVSVGAEQFEQDSAVQAAGADNGDDRADDRSDGSNETAGDAESGTHHFSEWDLEAWVIIRFPVYRLLVTQETPYVGPGARAL